VGDSGWWEEEEEKEEHEGSAWYLSIATMFSRILCSSSLSCKRRRNKKRWKKEKVCLDIDPKTLTPSSALSSHKIRLGEK
jgi:hypothetical protein